MLFNSLQFAIFLPIVLVLFFGLPHRYRWLLLLLASYGFYMAWEPAYGILIFASTVVDYWVARRMPEAGGPGRRRAWLMLSLCVNLGLLFSFKYYNLINGTFRWTLASAGIDWPLPESNLLLPVGISFYTFQTLGYTLDVYWGKLEPERHFGIFALYVAYFPQLVAGPVERAHRLLPQLHAPVGLDWDRVASGLRLTAWGLFKKVVVADRLAELVDVVFADPHSYSGVAFAVGTIFFSYQVYLDFSGYSDIAIGVARIMGVDLMTNFRQPYLSRSYTELWGRWHISMTTWFRDYLYIPLGGSRVTLARWCFNVYVVFLLSGLWHGADWSLAVWGSLNGLVLIAERLTHDRRAAAARWVGLDRRPRLRAVQQWLVVFITWQLTAVFFRAESISDAAHMLSHLHEGWWILGNPTAFGIFLTRMHMEPLVFVYCWLLIPFTELVDHLISRQDVRAAWNRLPPAGRWLLDWSLVYAILLLGRFDHVAFIYFQF